MANCDVRSQSLRACSLCLLDHHCNWPITPSWYLGFGLGNRNMLLGLEKDGLSSTVCFWKDHLMKSLITLQLTKLSICFSRNLGTFSLGLKQFSMLVPVSCICKIWHVYRQNNFVFSHNFLRKCWTSKCWEVRCTSDATTGRQIVLTRFKEPTHVIYSV